INVASLQPLTTRAEIAGFNPADIQFQLNAVQQLITQLRDVVASPEALETGLLGQAVTQLQNLLLPASVEEKLSGLSAGIHATTSGGNGGAGGAGGTMLNNGQAPRGGAGGNGGAGGAISITNSGSIVASGSYGLGLVALSFGGNAGNGGGN